MNARAAWDVTIGAASTGGAWSGANPDVWTPSGSGSTVAASEIESRLSGGTSVTIVTGGGGTEAGDIMINEPVSWGTDTLTLSATNDINVNSVMTASGTAVLDLTAGGALNVRGRIDFPGRAGTGFLSVNGSGYTVINSLGAEGSTTGADLQGMRGNLAGNYALGADIDASSTGGWSSKFTPIGGSSTNFTGIFDGLGHTVDGLVISRSLNYSGLFGYSAGTVRNAGLTNVSATGNSYTGGLAGYNSGKVSNCFVTGALSGNESVGGLVGSNVFGTVSGSYSSASVNGSFRYVGGLVGANCGATLNSYATGPVSGGNNNVGGLVGINDNCLGGGVSNSYATGSVSGGTYVGGLVGYNAHPVNTSYATGSVSGSSNVGGLAGCNALTGFMGNSYWDTDTTGQSNSSGVNDGTESNLTGLPTAAAMTQANYSQLDFVNTWYMVDGQTRPFLRNEWSGVIRNGHQLQMMLLDKTATYILGADIALAGSLSNTSGAGGSSSALWGSGGFYPVGRSSGSSFTGVFDGMGHTIDGLLINHPSFNYAGLFGYSTGGVHNVGLTNIAVTGNSAVGGLVGWIQSGTVSDSYVEGTVSGGGNNVGGLTGFNGGTVSNCYAGGTVSGSGDKVGGLAAENGVTMSNCYSTASVSGGSSVGGLAGYNLGTVSNSFWDTETSGRPTSAGGTAKTTAEMQSLATFAVSGWDIDDAGGTGKTWRIYDGNTYPLLRGFLSPLTAAANDDSKTYDGNPYSGGNGLTLSDPSAAGSLSGILSFSGSSQGAVDRGIYVITPACWSDQQGYDISYVDGTLTISGIGQIITVTQHAPAEAMDGTGFTVAATANSGLGVLITTSGACTGSGTDTASITMTGGGVSCSVYFDQSGNGGYEAAPQVVESVAVQENLSVDPSGLGGGSVSGGGIDCVWSEGVAGGTCSGLYAYNTSFALTATPDSCSYPALWSGACEGSFGSTCNVTMDTGKTAGVVFNRWYRYIMVANPEDAYDTVAEAYAATAGGDVLLQARVFGEDAVLDRAVDVVFDSGWDCMFSGYGGDTSIRSLNVVQGSVQLKGNALVISP